MKKFNIRKVLDGLTAVSSSSSSSSASTQPVNKENDVIQETLQSEHFQLCKVGAFIAILFWRLALPSTNISTTGPLVGTRMLAQC